MPAGHAVPSATSPVDTQVGWPALHEIVPVRQTFPLGWHEAPAVHAPQAPFTQTWLVPQGVPSAALPIAAHVETPYAHDVTPDLHALPLGLHKLPAAHALPSPPRQP